MRVDTRQLVCGERSFVELMHGDAMLLCVLVDAVDPIIMLKDDK